MEDNKFKQEDLIHLKHLMEMIRDNLTLKDVDCIGISKIYKAFEWVQTMEPKIKRQFEMEVEVLKLKEEQQKEKAELIYKLRQVEIELAESKKKKRKPRAKKKKD